MLKDTFKDVILRACDADLVDTVLRSKLEARLLFTMPYEVDIFTRLQWVNLNKN